MTVEQRPALPSPDSPSLEFDPYQAAEDIYARVVAFKQHRGELRRASDITDEDELDDHFDELARVYKQTLLFLGLEWPSIDGA